MAPKDWPGLKLRVPRLMALHAQRALLDWCEEACKKQGRDHLTALNSKHISRLSGPSSYQGFIQFLFI